MRTEVACDKEGTGEREMWMMRTKSQLGGINYADLLYNMGTKVKDSILESCSEHTT